MSMEALKDAATLDPRVAESRAEVLCLMDSLVAHLNDEDNQTGWLVNGVPDGGPRVVLTAEQSEYYGNVVGSIQSGNTLCYSLTDVVEVRCFTTNHTTQHDDSIITVVECHLACTINQLKGTWHCLYVDVLRQGTMLFQR